MNLSKGEYVVNDEPRRKPLIPDVIRKPISLVWACVVPQLCLLAYHLWVWDLVKGEVDERGRTAFLSVLVASVVMMGLVSLVVLVMRRLKRQLDWKVASLLFIAHVAFLWYIVPQAQHMMPSTVAAWMLSPAQLVFMAFTLVMPALFFCCVHIAASEAKLTPGKDVGATVGLIIGPPALWYALVNLPHSITRHLWAHGVVGMLFLFITTAVVLCAFVRLLLYVYAKLGKSWLLLFLGSLILPLGGLILNIKIPFPCDLQDWSVYALTVLNAVAVMLPIGHEPSRNRLTIWCARCATYPFTLYFFLLFLPFLPLSIPAMIAAGGGFLILAPTFLFVVHSRVLLTEARLLSNRYRSRQLVALCVLMICVMPATYTARALLHKAALTDAIELVYHPDYKSADVYVDRAGVAQALKRLRNMKEGKYIPFLSDYYNAIAFNGMVLPDRKIMEMERVLLDERPLDIGSQQNDQIFDFFTGGFGRRRAPWQGRRTQISRDVDLTDASVSHEVSNAVCTASLVLTMRNTNQPLSEFVADLDIPEGVLVSGYWLDVAGEKVPGRLFDRKSAEWVYHMIRDTTRMDPGLLVYQDPNTVRLRVYPFARNETRYCGIEFTMPAGMNPVIKVGDQSVRLQDGAQLAMPGVARAVLPSGQQSVTIPAGWKAMPSTTRTPVLHFLVDASESAAADIESNLKQMSEVMALNRELLCKVTLVNSGSWSLTDRPVSGEDAISLTRATLADDSSFFAGFNAGRAVRYATLQSLDDPLAHKQVPCFVIVTKEEQQAGMLDDLGEFSRLRPDTLGYAFASDIVAEALITKPVHVLRAGGKTGVVSAEDGGVVVLDDGPIEILSSETGESVALAPGLEFDADTVYARGMGLWADYRSTVYDPPSADAARRGLIAEAREIGILYPEASYIVLENTAQWKMLERAEKQALGADSALEFDEFDAPAPSVLVLLGGFLLYGAVRKRGRRGLSSG